MQEYPKLTCLRCSDDPDLMGGAEECSHAYEMRVELETLRKQIKEVATLTNISQREAKEWKRKAEDLESQDASLRDFVNTALRETGVVTVFQLGFKDDLRNGITVLEQIYGNRVRGLQEERYEWKQRCEIGNGKQLATGKIAVELRKALDDSLRLVDGFVARGKKALALTPTRAESVVAGYLKALEQIADGDGPMTASMIIAREALAFRKGD